MAQAFDCVLQANSEESSVAAFHRLLAAVGNNHQGTYSSVAFGLLPVMERILREGGDWSQRAVIEVLIELRGSFQPAPGQEEYSGQPLAGLVRLEVSRFAPLLLQIKRAGGEAAECAGELLTLRK